jgi:predicted dehydrogenase
MEAFHYQYHPLAKRLVEIVRSGELGTIRNVDVSFSAPLWKKGDIRYQLALAGGATMDMGCYPISLLRLLAPGPRVISAEAKLSSPGVDRAMDAHFSLPDGGSAHIGCSMFSTSVLRMHAEVTGDNGNPGLVVMEAFHYQYHPLAKRLVEIIRSGELGNISNVDVSFSAPLWKKGDIRYQLALAGGATMDMGCYPISLLRLLTPGPRVISAEAKLSSPGVDRAMDAHFSLTDGGSAHLGFSMFSSSVLRLHAQVTGDNGKISVFNPFSPQYGHRMKVTTSLGTRKERFSRKPSYDFQLEAFVAAVEDGAPFPTTAADAIRTMELIDAIYSSADLPVRQPTPVG